MRVRILFVSTLVMVFIVGIGISGYAAEPPKPIKLSIAGTSAFTGAHKAACTFFAEKVKELTKGQVIVEIFLGGVLGGERECHELTSVGEIDMMESALGIAWYAPEYDATTISFYFPDYESMDRYWSPVNPIYANIQKTLLASGKLRHLGAFDMGVRAMTSSKPIHKPADLKGIKMRVQEIPQSVEVWKELGTLVTPLPGSEIVSALQTGVIDAQENTLSNIAGRSMWEVQKYVIFTNHSRMPQHVIISEKTWQQKLSNEQRAAIQQAANLLGKMMMKEIQKMDNEFINKFKEKGMVLINPEVEPFRKAAWPAVERLLSKLAPGVKEAADRVIKGGK